jgi:predicted nuclease with TOPRIM domain
MNHNSLREYAKYVRNERRADIAERLDEFADQWQADIFKRWQVDQLVLAKQDRIEELEADNAALRERVGEMEARLYSIECAECGRNLMWCKCEGPALASLPEVKP